MVVNRGPLRTIRPVWPTRDRIDPARVAFTYDGVSDTLFVDLFGRALPAVSVPVASISDRVDVYARVDAVTDEVVGLQIEGVSADDERDAWVDGALALAEQRGVAPGTTPRPIGDPAAEDRRAVVDALLEAVAPVAA